MVPRADLVPTARTRIRLGTRIAPSVLQIRAVPAAGFHACLVSLPLEVHVLLVLQARSRISLEA